MDRVQRKSDSTIIKSRDAIRELTTVETDAVSGARLGQPLPDPIPNPSPTNPGA